MNTKLLNCFENSHLMLNILKSYKDEKRYYSMDYEKLQKIQLKRLKEIVNHAYTNVPLYQQKWDDAGISPKDIKTLEDIQKLPIITKNDLRNGFPDKILSKKFPRSRVYEFATTGSTGSSLCVFYDKTMLSKVMSQMSPYYASYYLSKKIRKVARIVVIDDDSMESISPNKLKRDKTHIIDAREPVEKLVDFICSVKPEVILSYPRVIVEVCLFALRKKYKNA